MRAIRGEKNYLLFIGVALIIFFLDQSSKWIAVNQIEAHQIFSVIPGFFNLVLVKNRGMAFGIFSQARSGFYYFFLLATTIGVTGVILFFFFWIKEAQIWLTIGLSLILGGAVGNLVDRIRLGYVIDFLDFFVKDYHWPAFNVADSAVTIGTLWLLFNIILGRKIIEAG
jgi:signal peptidase II